MWSLNHWTTREGPTQNFSLYIISPFFLVISSKIFTRKKHPRGKARRTFTCSLLIISLRFVNPGLPSNLNPIKNPPTMWETWVQSWAGNVITGSLQFPAFPWGSFSDVGRPLLPVTLPGRKLVQLYLWILLRKCVLPPGSYFLPKNFYWKRLSYFHPFILLDVFKIITRPDFKCLIWILIRFVSNVYINLEGIDVVSFRALDFVFFPLLRRNVCCIGLWLFSTHFCVNMSEYSLGYISSICY